MHVAGDSVLLHGGSSCAVDAGQYLSPEASYIGMELRGNRDVMMFIRISEVGDSVVPRFGVYGVFVVGSKRSGVPGSPPGCGAGGVQRWMRAVRSWSRRASMARTARLAPARCPIR